MSAVHLGPDNVEIARGATAWTQCRIHYRDLGDLESELTHDELEATCLACVRDRALRMREWAEEITGRAAAVESRLAALECQHAEEGK